MSKRAKQYVLNCRILQNGRPIKDFQTNYGENKQLSATSNGDDPLGITNYPLSRPISIVNSSKNGTYIEIDHPWEGYIISEGELNTVNGYHDLGKSFKITPGDIVSLGWHDLRFLFKIEKKSIAQKKPISMLRGKDRGPLFKKIGSGKDEAVGLYSGLILAIIFFGFIIAGLMQRVGTRPDTIEQLSLEYAGPFVSPDHVITAPEALQDNLDRSNYLRSIYAYYRSMASTLLGIEENIDDSMTSPTLVEVVSKEEGEFARKQEESILMKGVNEEMLLSKQGKALIDIPIIKRHSKREQAVALIERINQIHDGLKNSLEAKRTFIKEFEKQTGYNWSDYTRESQKVVDDRAIFTGAKNAFSKPKGEDAMYIEAEKLAKIIEFMQNRYLSNISETSNLTNENINSLFVMTNNNTFNFTKAISHITSNEKLNSVTASRFGDKKTVKIKEPLVGNIDADKVLKTISTKRFDVQLCYESALRRNQSLKGEMVWQWLIDTRGRPSEIQVVDSDLSDSKLTRCIRKKLARWKFPKARNGSVKINHKFKFKPARG